MQVIKEFMCKFIKRLFKEPPPKHFCNLNRNNLGVCMICGNKKEPSK